MTEIKLFHKILIVIVVAWVLLKVSSMKLPNILQRRPDPPTRDAPQRREARRIEVASYIPAPAPRGRAPAASMRVDEDSFRRLCSEHSSGRMPHREEVRVPCAVTIPSVATPSSGSGIHIDDATFHRFYG